MILSTKTKIMIVPDFGEGTDSEAMVALKGAIDAERNYVVKVVDLPALVQAEHEDEELKDSEVIELSARKLEQLSHCPNLVWDGSNDTSIPETKVVKLKLRNRHGHTLDLGYESESAYAESKSEHELPLVDDRQIDPDDTIRIDEEYSVIELGSPDALVVFGKSSMLASGIGRCNVLFVNPRYDSEWPWKKQYYADWRLVGKFRQDICDYESDRMTTVTWSGTEVKIGRDYSMRYGLFTRYAGLGEFWDHYPRMAEMDGKLEGNAKELADFICRFADGDLTNPLEEIYTALSRFPRLDELDFKWICRFPQPLEVGGTTILGIQFGTPMANGQSCYKLKVQGVDYTIPLERFNTRWEYNLLRDAILRTRSQLKGKENPQRRILIVPDYFTPYDAPYVRELYNRLTDMDYQVAVLMPDSSLAKSRKSLERRCKSKPFDLIVTLETGCLLAARVTNCQRIFVNPDWTAWEWMKLRLGDSKQLNEKRGTDKSGPVYTYILNADEIDMAREMAERSNIRHGNHIAAGWFSEDEVNSHLPIEHLKRFNTNTLIPSLRLDTEEGIAILANQIHNTLTVDDE